MAIITSTGSIPIYTISRVRSMQQAIFLLVMLQKAGQVGRTPRNLTAAPPGQCPPRRPRGSAHRGRRLLAHPSHNSELHTTEIANSLNGTRDNASRMNYYYFMAFLIS